MPASHAPYPILHTPVPLRPHTRVRGNAVCAGLDHSHSYDCGTPSTCAVPGRVCICLASSATKTSLTLYAYTFCADISRIGCILVRNPEAYKQTLTCMRMCMCMCSDSQREQGLWRRRPWDGGHPRVRRQAHAAHAGPRQCERQRTHHVNYCFSWAKACAATQRYASGDGDSVAKRQGGARCKTAS
jgi:hypothetical protein